MSQIFNTLSMSIIIIFILMFGHPSEQLSLDEFLSLNQNQKVKMDEFRQLMVSLVPHDYMKKDVYLIRWLRDSNFDIPAAEERLLNHLKWREENDIDSILQENWTEFDDEFKLYMEGCSKDGKPVVSFRVGNWDIRRYVIAGRTKQLLRFMDKIFEEGESLVRRMREDGQNVTQGFNIFDINNFNLVQQACPRCLVVFFNMIRNTNYNYPGGIHRICLINVPQAAIPIWEVLRTALEPKTREIISLFGRDKSSWSTSLLKEINKNQLSVMHGGSNAEAVDFEDLRIAKEVYRCKDNS